MNLNNPQRELLAKVATARGQVYHCYNDNAQADHLVKHGLCEWQDGARLCLTDAGRDYVAANGRTL